MVDMNMKRCDLKFGKNSEDIVLIQLRKYFGKNIQKYKNKYSTFDFFYKEDNKLDMVIELKSRRNSLKQYDTQLIGNNKIQKGFQHLENGTKVFICYCLNDGLFIFELKPEMRFKTCLLGNYARGDKKDELALIPNEFLTPIQVDTTTPSTTLSFA